MNQPWSSCSNWIQELTRVQDPGAQRVIRTGDDVFNDNLSPLSLDADVQFDDQHVTKDIFDRDEKLVNPDQMVVDEYPGAARIYGYGSTFMDRFDNDVYSTHWVENLYYPFASKQDWEVGQFLGSSRLSLAAIDQFLNLELVCISSVLVL
jgi:hypothetical protein